MSNINITIDGCCSMHKYEIAEEIGKMLKQMSFGQVNITGVDYKGDYYKGMLKDETVEIRVVPDMDSEQNLFSPSFKGNKEFVTQQRQRNRMVLDKVIKYEKGK